MVFESLGANPLPWAGFLRPQLSFVAANKVGPPNKALAVAEEPYANLAEASMLSKAYGEADVLWAIIIIIIKLVTSMGSKVLKQKSPTTCEQGSMLQRTFFFHSKAALVTTLQRNTQSGNLNGQKRQGCPSFLRL